MNASIRSGPIFLPVAGIMASIPLLRVAIEALCGPAFEFVGADPAMAATTFIAVDMGGYQYIHGNRSYSPLKPPGN